MDTIDTACRTALHKVMDALDEQAVEVTLLRLNIKRLQDEMDDLKANMLRYHSTLEGVAVASGRLRAKSVRLRRIMAGAEA
jgi:hypothetical protein